MINVSLNVTGTAKKEKSIISTAKNGDDNMEDKKKIQKAKELIVSYGRVNGDHHKAWVLDQVFRILCGSDYKKEVAKAKAGENGPDTYDWREGIPP